MKLIKLALATTTIAFAAPIATAQDAATDTAISAQTMVNVKVNGMVCDFCARAVTKVFGKQEAVENVHVDLDNGEIHVTLKPGAALSDETVADLVKKSGYDLVAIERETA
ncbi:MAG: heavy-metal-associated domain-containing protein [Henriciella sp.]|nr:heavy-metal-associated domain-containing protein [Henriciella sp.]